MAKVREKSNAVASPSVQNVPVQPTIAETKEQKNVRKHTADMTNAQRAAAVIIALGADKASKI